MADGDDIVSSHVNHNNQTTGTCILMSDDGNGVETKGGQAVGRYFEFHLWREVLYHSAFTHFFAGENGGIGRDQILNWVFSRVRWMYLHNMRDSLFSFSIYGVLVLYSPFSDFAPASARNWFIIIIRLISMTTDCHRRRSCG